MKENILKIIISFMSIDHAQVPERFLSNPVSVLVN